MLSSISVLSQNKELTLKQATDYLRFTLNSDLEKQPNIYGGTKSIDIEVFEDEIQIDYIWSNYKDVINYDYKNTDINYNRIVFNINEINTLFLKKYNAKYAIAIQCKDKTKRCFQLYENAIKAHYASEFIDSPKATNHFDFLHLFYLADEVNQRKVYNALIFILQKLNNKNNKLALIDPFVKARNETKKVIDLIKKNGVFSLNANLGGLTNNLLLDSGASDVSLPNNFVTKLIAKGYVSEKNFLTPGLYTIADGSIVESRRFIIPYIKVKDIVIKNVRCSINKSDNVFLLGKTFLDRFKSWKINNKTNQLILEF